MADTYKVKGTYDTPEVDFDLGNGVFKLEGRSMPSNSFEFFDPLLNVINTYLSAPKELTIFDFKMDFISSSSTKIFQDIFIELEKILKDGHDVKINWYYRFGDDDMKELGQELREDSALPMEFIAYK